ncbi:MAG: TRAP transporter large permease, partial [Bacteriovorax sp.]
MNGWVVTIGICLLAGIGVPLFIIMGLAALAAFSFSGVEVSAVAQEMYRISSAPTLMTIPLFTFAGYLMAESHSPK